MTKRATPIRTLAVFGVGAAVLVAILYYASTVDGQPPTVRRVSVTQHLTADTKVALTTTSIEIDFSEPVQHATAEAAFAISPTVRGTFSWSSASLTFTPAERLPLRTNFEVTIGPGARDAAGNEMAGRASPFRFTTVGNPSVVASQPTDVAADVALDAPIVVDFSTLMDTSSVERALRLSPAIEVRLRWARERLTIVPVAPLDPDRGYSLTIGAGALDQAGTPLDRPFALRFRTVVASLAARTMVPADGVSGIAVTTPIAILFDRALDPGTVHDNLLTVTPAVAGSLEAVAAPGAAGLLDGKLRMLRFQPSGPLEPNTTYNVTLGPGLLDEDGVGLPAGLSWSFTTGAPAATLSNQIVFLSDRAGFVNLWAMNPDGTNQRQLSTELSPVIDYAVAPDGRAFVVGDGALIVWQRADGSARSVLTDVGSLEFDPAYSPDGSALTFARADPATGGGLGLWLRDADGSHPRQVQLPSGDAASPSPGSVARGPLLRAPRLSPDGTALAFVDTAGRVAILDLATQRVTAASFIALSEPIWLPDGSGVIVSGLAPGSSGTQGGFHPHAPLLALDPRSLGRDAARIAALRIVRLARGATSVTQTAFGIGAARPTLDGSGRFAYIRLEADDAASGNLWVSGALVDTGVRVVHEPGLPAGVSSFAPEPQAMVISRVPAPGDAPTASDGIWLVDLRSGEATHLSTHGWLPRWLP